MSFYSKNIFPALCDLLLGQPRLATYRRKLLASVSGAILEIGFGTGLNLPHYPRHVRKITTVDANPGTQPRATRRIERSRITVEQRLLDCARLPFPDQTWDCVVSSWTLCSIDDVNQALGEVYRVLKPGGRFLFLEHGLSPEAGVQKWQRRLNWLEQQLGEGCRLDRNIRELVARPPFASVEVKESYLPGFPKTHGYMYRGTARK